MPTSIRNPRTATGWERNEQSNNTIVGSIDSAILQHVSDIVLNPPVTDKYEIIRKRLIDNFSDSDTKRLKRLLSELELGDKRPFQLLREMQSLVVNLYKEIIQQLWLQRLPTSTQAILSTSTEGLQKLAEMADKICEVTQMPEVNSLQTQRADMSNSQYDKFSLFVSLSETYITVPPNN